MNRFIVSILLLFVFLFSGVKTNAEDNLPNYAFVNGNWFNGKSFEKKDFFSVKGILTNSKPQRIDYVIDLKGNFVIPPFGEAHNHNLDQPREIQNQIRMYLREGVFYSKNQSHVPLQTNKIRDLVNKRSSVDVSYANGGLGASGGHIVEIYERFLRRGFFRSIAPDWQNKDLDTKAFFLINDEDDLRNKWKLILKDKPDFIKTFLEYSEEYEKRKDNPAFYGAKGIKPEILRQIIEKAHKANLRVSTHIETAADFRNAVLAGADEIAHMPGYKIPENVDISKFQLTKEDAKLAAEKETVVLTTTHLSNNLFRNNPKQLEVVKNNYKRNLKLLHENGVRIALGSDDYGTTSLNEALNLHEFKVFDNLSLLKYWCEETPKTIFPKRKIGHLKEGFEASFIALKGNPLKDFMNVRRINLRFKQGMLLNLKLSEEEKFINLILTEGTRKAIKIYEQKRKNNPYIYSFSERSFNRLGYQFIRERKIKDAVEIFKLIVKKYPNSANAYDSLAEAYQLNGKKELAIKNYKKSLELNPKNENAKNQLSELGDK